MKIFIAGPGTLGRPVVVLSRGHGVVELTAGWRRMRISRRAREEEQRVAEIDRSAPQTR
jgi:hypothetical protein